MASREVNIILPQRGVREHHAVGMKGSGSDGVEARVLEEAAVRLYSIQEGAIDIEDIHGVAFRTTVCYDQCFGLSGHMRVREAYMANTGACSWTLNVLRVSFVALIVRSGVSLRISHSLISPLRLPLTSSLRPPLCMCTLVIHCL